MREIGTGAATALTLKTLSFGSSYLLSIAVARLLGPAEAGLFFLSLTIVTVLSSLTRLGVDKPLVRHVASLAAVGEKESLRGAVGAALMLAGIAAVAVSAVTWAGSQWVSTVVFGKPELAAVLGPMAWALPALVVSSMISFAFQGLRRIALHLVLLSALTPIAMLAFIGAQLIVDSDLNLALLYTFAAGVTLLTALAGWGAIEGPRGFIPDWKSFRPVLSSGRITFVVVAAQLMIGWIPTLLLGALGSSQQVALFHVADRTALLISFILIAVNSIAAPKFAALYATGHTVALESTVRQTTRIMFLAALPIAIVFCAIPDQVLHLFGRDYVGASAMLRILAAGQLVNTATGSVAILLLMTGHERELRNIILLGASGCLIAGMIVVPLYGAVGAAIVSASSVAAVNLCAAREVRKKFGFWGLA